MNLIPVLTTTIQEYVDVPLDSLTRATNPTLDLDLNSYDLMSILGKLEDELGIRFDDREIRSLVTLGDLDDYIRAQLT